MEGYGQTESTGGSFLTYFKDNKGGSVGGPTACTEFKIKAVPEMDYKISDINQIG